jgi:hypothetical protein
MKRVRHLSFPLAGALVALGVFAAVPIQVAPAPITLTQQIDALLKRRLRPEPLPLDLPNPFALPGNGGGRRDAAIQALNEPAGAATNPPRTNPNEEARVATSAEVLAESAARLRFGGIMRVQGRVQLVINDVPRKEGDTIVVPWNNTRISLQIVSILADQVVLRYNEADYMLRF